MSVFQSSRSEEILEAGPGASHVNGESSIKCPGHQTKDGVASNQEGQLMNGIEVLIVLCSGMAVKSLGKSPVLMMCFAEFLLMVAVVLSRCSGATKEGSRVVRAPALLQRDANDSGFPKNLGEMLCWWQNVSFASQTKGRHVGGLFKEVVSGHLSFLAYSVTFASGS